MKLLSLPSELEKKAELGTGFYMGNNFGLSVEAGYGKLTPSSAYKNTDYRSEGYYGRIGLNYLYEYQPGVRLYLGIKYSECRFSDHGVFTIQSPLWNDYQGSFDRPGLKANWSEIIFGSESQWKHKFLLGFIVRMRIMIHYPKFEDIPMYSIPGYGKTMDKTTPAINLYIKYLLDFTTSR
jgi:hypothetical protein